jgi:cytochrome d ubiquinol oxidase subunit II
VIWGWGVAQHPYLLPKSLTISQGAAGEATLDAVLIVFGVAVVVVLPALAFLYILTQRSVLQGETRPPERAGPASGAEL